VRLGPQVPVRDRTARDAAYDQLRGVKHGGGLREILGGVGMRALKRAVNNRRTRSRRG